MKENAVMTDNYKTVSSLQIKNIIVDCQQSKVGSAVSSDPRQGRQVDPKKYEYNETFS